METPSSTRRVTRSQTLASASASSAINTNIPSSRKIEEFEKNMSKSVKKSGKKQQQDRSALFDITNDSPIVGLAMGSLETPSSAVSKKRMSSQGQFTRTPGSGEALLRGQVKTLLQKVEEEAELSKIAVENRPLFNLQGLIKSPINLIAPTPANTPQVFSLSANGDCLPSLSPSPVADTFLYPQMLNGMFDEKKQDVIESESMITRSLFLDFSEKSDSSDCSSVVSYQGVICEGRDKVSTDDDDDASVWSIQVNASSTPDEDDEEEVVMKGCIEDEEEYCDEEGEGLHEFVGDNGWTIDDVCEGMRKISVGTMFEGKHVRFVYNSDGEIEKEEEVGFQTP